MDVFEGTLCTNVLLCCGEEHEHVRALVTVIHVRGNVDECKVN